MEDKPLFSYLHPKSANSIIRYRDSYGLGTGGEIGYHVFKFTSHNRSRAGLKEDS
jgi:hypothetical protein